MRKVIKKIVETIIDHKQQRIGEVTFTQLIGYKVNGDVTDICEAETLFGDGYELGFLTKSKAPRAWLVRWFEVSIEEGAVKFEISTSPRSELSQSVTITSNIDATEE